MQIIEMLLMLLALLLKSRSLEICMSFLVIVIANLAKSTQIYI